MTDPPIIYVDVDDTLVRSFGSKRIPIANVVERIKELSHAGFTMYCWSSGGAEYCKATAVELGIEACFRGFLPKPHVMLDDQHPSEWRLLRWVHPNEAAAMNPDDYTTNKP